MRLKLLPISACPMREQGRRGVAARRGRNPRWSRSCRTRSWHWARCSGTCCPRASSSAARPPISRSSAARSAPTRAWSPAWGTTTSAGRCSTASGRWASRPTRCRSTRRGDGHRRGRPGSRRAAALHHPGRCRLGSDRGRLRRDVPRRLGRCGLLRQPRPAGRAVATLDPIAGEGRTRRSDADLRREPPAAVRRSRRDRGIARPGRMH